MTARAAEHGLDSELVEEIVGRGGERLQRGGVARDGALEHAGSMVGEGELGDVLAGPVGLTARANTFDEGAVLREFAAGGGAGVARRHGARAGRSVRGPRRRPRDGPGRTDERGARQP